MVTMEYTLNQGQFENKPQKILIKLYEWIANDGGSIACISIGKHDHSDLFFQDIAFIYQDGSITVESRLPKIL